MSPLQEYLQAVHLIHATGAGTKETSYYAPLERLLNRIGAGMKPTVRAVFQLKNTGAGNPDFGLFTADQFERREGDLKAGQVPSRGAGEVKGTAESLDALTSGAQVSKYWERYRQVLVTNLRSFAFVVEDAKGQPHVVERLDLAPSEGGFWAMAAHADRVPEEDAAAAEAFLERCLRHAAPLDAPRDLAWFLASYGREARARLDRAPLETLAPLREALEGTLGVRFAGERGERFFRATVVQTLFYGLFSAWVLWHRESEHRTDAFRWRDAGDYLHVPVLLRLFEDLTRTTTLKTLELRDLVERATDTLNRVDRSRFFARFADAEAIQYFYEPFLEAYDPHLRKELGVWYTPGEVVRYMVARVDAVLREELGIADGLADERVVVLDPACGTGAFLVEVIRCVRRTLEDQGGGGLVGARLKKAVTERLFGFELLTAPFVVAHLQVGLALRAAGVPMQAGERAAVYLTNALTGWVPSMDEAQAALALNDAFRDEADHARHVKRDERILVVIGNPPYDGYAGVAIEEERRWTDDYRTPTRAGIRPQGQGLNDLYVRFFRVAERQITERTGRGVVCFISNNSWLDGLSHPALRERFLDAFDHVWIDNLHGDKYRTGKLTPDGRPDPSVFSTEYNREGIQVGTAVALLVRSDPHEPAGEVRYRDLWGREKLAMLDALGREGTLSGLGADTPDYRTLAPEPLLGLPFLPGKTGDDYLDWPKLPDLFPASYAGVKTARDEALVDVDRTPLDARMRAYFDAAVSNVEMAEIAPRLIKPASRFDPLLIRRALAARGYRPERIVPYLYRPFDLRWLYWETETKLLDERRSDYAEHVFEGNIWFISTTRNRKDNFYAPQITKWGADFNVIEANAQAFPLYLAPDVTTGGAVRPNLSKRALDYLAATGASPEALFYHTLAVLHAPAYREENAGALRQDWPRVPLPASAEALAASAALGREVAALLDVETPVAGVTTGAVRPELRPLAAPTRTDGAQLTEADFAVTARWGYLGHTGQTMPGPGHTAARPRPAAQPDALGATARDVYLNDRARWEAVPEKVWAYTLGGYPVLKKWLSYRNRDVLGRPLRLEEVEAFRAIARRIAALLLLDDALDANYAAARRTV